MYAYLVVHTLCVRPSSFHLLHSPSILFTSPIPQNCMCLCTCVPVTLPPSLSLFLSLCVCVCVCVGLLAAKSSSRLGLFEIATHVFFRDHELAALAHLPLLILSRHSRRRTTTRPHNRRTSQRAHQTLLSQANVRAKCYLDPTQQAKIEAYLATRQTNEEKQESKSIIPLHERVPPKVVGSGAPRPAGVCLCVDVACVRVTTTCVCVCVCVRTQYIHTTHIDDCPSAKIRALFASCC